MPRTFNPRVGKDYSAYKPFAYAFILIAACCVALGFSPLSLQVVRSQDESGAHRSLSMGERVMYQRALDEVYWRHTEWPKENTDSKPSFDEVVTVEQTTAKVEDTLRKSEALNRRWGRPISASQLQSEVERMARETKRPDLLRELWQALNNDPYVIAEVLARPALVERLARTSFSSESKSETAPAAGFDSWWGSASGEYTAEVVPASDFSYQLAEINQAGAGADDTWKPMQSLPIGTGTAVWTGTEVIIWGGGTSMGGRTNLGSRYNPATDTWTSTSTVGAPDERSGHTAVWTGTEMIVWGGSNGIGRVNTGGRYNPATDTWTPTANGNVFRSGHTAVWTGKQMIIWGGCTITGSDGCRIGGVYDPASNTWKPTSLVNAPTHRIGHRAVWTGSEMLIWGGSNATAGNTGGRYNPDTDTWRATNTFNAPSARAAFTMVWTGKEAIVWGGYEGNFVTLNTGGRYNPATDTWTPTSTANPAAARFGHTAVWTGTEMIVYGGDLRPTGNNDQITNTGGRYNPATDSWTQTSTANAPVKSNHVAVWTGEEMFVWGGNHVSQTIFKVAGRYKPSTDSWIPTNNQDSVSSANLGAWTGAEMIVLGKNPGCISVCDSVGGRYDPATNLWRAISLANAPAGDYVEGSAAVWTGREMILWGAMNAAGARYNPLTDTWTRASTANAPAGKMHATAVWTGTEMLVWGGDNNPDNVPSAGGRYNPSTDTWKLMSMVDAPAARNLHSAVWTGEEMVVWGGSQYFSGSQINTGGRYNPQTDTWRPTSTAGAPEARLYNTAVWTGEEMVVWGGWVYSNEGSRYLDTGGRYNPATDAWQPTSMSAAPAARSHHRAVWTGSMMIIWGGRVPVTWTSTGDATYTGARYNPASDIWTPTSLQSAPSRRDSHVQVWTGTQMLVFGGKGASGAPVQDGGIYNAPGATAGNTLPSVRVSSPTENARFLAGDSIQISAEASDGDGTVSSVNFYANDTLLGTDREAPYSFTWNSVRSGSYALTAVASDNSGGVTRSAPVNILVEAIIGLPNAVVTSPADGATFPAPATIRVAADVTPNPDRPVTKVEFWLSAGKGGTQTLVHTDTTAPYAFDLANQPEGTYVIYAFAYDSQDVGLSPGARYIVTGPSRPFNISGQVTDAGGSGIGGLGVRLAGTDEFTTATDANGYYFFGHLLRGGNYVVMPTAPNYSYAPPSQTFNNLSGNQNDANFTATPSGHTISGRLTFADGSPLYPATVNLSGGATRTTATDVNGYYFFSNLTAGGFYTVQPYKNAYSFTPGFRTYDNLRAPQTANFTGSVNNFTVSGRVTISNKPDEGYGGVTMKLAGAQGTLTVRTNGQGFYSFPSVPGGTDYTLTASANNISFEPPSRAYAYLSQNQTAADFKGTMQPAPVVTLTSPAQGAVYDMPATVRVAASAQAGAGRNITKVEFYLGDGMGMNLKPIGTDTTAPYGEFDLTGQAAGNYSLYAYAYDDGVGVAFSEPLYYSVKAPPVTYSIAGRVADARGVALGGVTISLAGDAAETATTGADGRYSFGNLAAGAGYTVMPYHDDYTFTPAHRDFDALGFNQTADFVAAANAPVSSPFGGSPASMPGVFQAENFDEGGEGVAFHDTTPQNEGGAYRQTGVDLYPCPDGGCDRLVGWLKTGEWLGYTVQAAGGVYTFEARASNGAAGGRFHVEVDGTDVTGSLQIPNTGSPFVWQTVSKEGVNLTAGKHVVRVVVETEAADGWAGNFDWFKFTAAGQAAPVRIPAENFDDGGEGVAFHDTTAANEGGAYRQTPVDIYNCAGGGCDYIVGWIKAGEWMKYTADLNAPGLYTVRARVSNGDVGGRFHVEVDGVDVTGTMTIPNTGDPFTWQVVSKAGVNLSAGRHAVRVVMDAEATHGWVGNFDWIEFEPAAVGGAPIAVEAEDFDDGGEGVGFHDTTAANEGGAYRQTGVDLYRCPDGSCGHLVGWIKSGEWLRYTVDVAAGGTYAFEARVSNGEAGGRFHLEVDGVDVTGPLQVPNTGSPFVWQTVGKSGVSLTPGRHVLRLVMEAEAGFGWVGNFDWLRLSPQP